MRVLGIETSSPRGSVALVEGGVLVARAEHSQASSHAERVLPLIAELLASAGWPRGSLDRLGVGAGPGSFTGLRVGLALAQGIALGLDRPVVGVGSLAALAHAVPAGVRGLRVAVLDARRAEVFVAVYEEDGSEVVAPVALPVATALAAVLARLEGGRHVLVGAAAAGLLRAAPLRSPETDLPDATFTALLAAALDPLAAPPEPLYVRDADAKLPELPPSPLA